MDHELYNSHSNWRHPLTTVTELLHSTTIVAPSYIYCTTFNEVFVDGGRSQEFVASYSNSRRDIHREMFLSLTFAKSAVLPLVAMATLAVPAAAAELLWAATMNKCRNGGDGDSDSISLPWSSCIHRCVFGVRSSLMANDMRTK